MDLQSYNLLYFLLLEFNEQKRTPKTLTTTSADSVKLLERNHKICFYVKIWYQNWIKKNDKNDEYPHIITSVCSTLLPLQYGIIPATLFSPDNPCYRDVLEQYYLVWFNLVVGILLSQWYLLHKIFFLSQYSQRDGTKWRSCLVQILWTLYSELWDFRNTMHIFWKCNLIWK